MWCGERQGFLIIQGNSPTPLQLSRLTGGRATEIENLLRELCEAGVSATNEEGVIYSKRMVRDLAASKLGCENGKKGGNPVLTSPIATAQPLTPHLTPHLTTHLTTPLILDTDTDTDTPKVPRGTEEIEEQIPAPDSASNSALLSPPPSSDPGDQLLTRAKELFRMRATTPLDSSQTRAWQKKETRAAVTDTSDDDWQMLEWAYSQSSGDASTYRRKDLASMLNNWSCEISRARDWAKKSGARIQPAAKPTDDEPTQWRNAAQKMGYNEFLPSAQWHSLTWELRNEILAFLESDIEFSANHTETTQP